MTLELSTDEQLALLILKPGRTLGRLGFKNEPFKLRAQALNTPAASMRFSEADVYGLIEKKLVTVTQTTAAIAGYPAMPFSVILSAEGERLHHRLMSERPRQ